MFVFAITERRTHPSRGLGHLASIVDNIHSGSEQVVSKMPKKREAVLDVYESRRKGSSPRLY